MNTSKNLTYRRVIFCLLCFISISLFFFLNSAWLKPHRPVQDRIPIMEAPEVQTEKQACRKQQVKNGCKKFVSESFLRLLENMNGITNATNGSSKTPNDFHSLYYDDINKIIYCEVPKVACSNWKRVLLVLSGKVVAEKLTDIPVNEVHSNLSKAFLHRMDTLSMPEILRRLNPSSGYFKFLFVRAPYERLLSAYRNKFLAPYSLYFQEKFGRFIVKLFRGVNASNESLARGHDVTFKEFIKFVIDKEEEKIGRETNAHWRPVSELCMPCIVDYDFIGKYEHMDRGDIYFVLDRLKATNLSFPPAYHSGSNKTVSILRGFYDNISSHDIHKIKLRFEDDFKMFYPEDKTESLLLQDRELRINGT